MTRTKQTARKSVTPRVPSSSSSDNESATRPTRREGKEPARGSSSRGDEEQPPGLKWRRDDILARLETISFTPTRYPDMDFLKKTRLLDDASAMFDEMSLGKFMRIPHDTYVDMVKEFFSTLVIHLSDSEFDSERRDRNDYIEFTMAGQHYTVTCPELTTIYGLRGGYRHSVQVYKADYQKLWKSISHGSFRGGVSKSSRIHHPTIRYVHKALTNTFYARKDGDSVTEPEMNLLFLGLKPFFEDQEEEQRLHVTSLTVSFRAMFIKMLGSIQDWVMNTRAAKPTMTMGGLLTPLPVQKDRALWHPITLHTHGPTLPPQDRVPLRKAGEPLRVPIPSHRR